MALKKAGKNEYELAVGQKVYRVKFSMGVKDRLVELVVSNYARHLDGNMLSGLVPRDMTAQIMDVYERLLKSETDEERVAIQTELQDIVSVFTEDHEVAQRTQLIFQKRLLQLSDALKYEVWSELLTQRNMEGAVTEYVSPDRIKDGGEFDDCVDELLDLLTVAYTVIEETLKKTSEMTAKTGSLLGNLTSSLETLLPYSQSSTQPMPED